MEMRDDIFEVSMETFFMEHVHVTAQRAYLTALKEGGNDDMYAKHSFNILKEGFLENISNRIKGIAKKIWGFILKVISIFKNAVYHRIKLLDDLLRRVSRDKLHILSKRVTVSGATNDKLKAFFSKVILDINLVISSIERMIATDINNTDAVLSEFNKVKAIATEYGVSESSITGYDKKAYTYSSDVYNKYLDTSLIEISLKEISDRLGIINKGREDITKFESKAKEMSSRVQKFASEFTDKHNITSAKYSDISSAKNDPLLYMVDMDDKGASMTFGARGKDLMDDYHHKSELESTMSYINTSSNVILAMISFVNSVVEEELADIPKWQKKFQDDK